MKSSKPLMKIILIVNRKFFHFSSLLFFSCNKAIYAKHSDIISSSSLFFLIEKASNAKGKICRKLLLNSNEMTFNTKIVENSEYINVECSAIGKVSFEILF